MASRRIRFMGVVLIAAACVCRAAPVRGQGLELAPFGGYRFGGGFFEIETGQPIDLDGAPALGFVLNVPLSNGCSFEGLITHQTADVFVPTVPSGRPILWRITVDHWQGGALQEYGRGRARPFLSGLLGLTRFAAEGDNEIRFTVGAGGGIKLFPVHHVGVRLDGRVFATFVQADTSASVCGSGTCFVGLDVDVVWQVEFTAGLVVRFP